MEPEEIYNKLYSQLDSKYELVYTHYDYNFDNNIDLQQAMLQGNNEEVIDAFSEQTEQWISDQQYDSATEIIEDLLEAVDDEDKQYFLASPWFDELRMDIIDRDDSNIFESLCSNTSDTWTTYKLWDDEDIGFITGDFYNDFEDRQSNRQAIIDALKIDPSTINPWLENIMANSHYGGELRVLWYGNVYELSKQITDQTKTIIFPAGSEVGLIDYLNGSGYTESIPCDIEVPFDRSRLELDKTRSFGGYAEGICGLWSGGFKEPAPKLI